MIGLEDNIKYFITKEIQCENTIYVYLTNINDVNINKIIADINTITFFLLDSIFYCSSLYLYPLYYKT